MRYIKSILIGLSLMISCVCFSEVREDIEARIKPIGQVQVAGDESSKIAIPLEAVMPAPAATMSGEDVYKKYCVVCHSVGVAGAPKLQDKTTWGARPAKGIDNLLKTAISGLNAMPPKGTCMTCSNDELKAAINYMLPK